MVVEKLCAQNTSLKKGSSISSFSGGLSVNLNHLIASGLGIFLICNLGHFPLEFFVQFVHKPPYDVS